MPSSPPTVVIVGRPNVGKSTLFNRITGQRRAIVGDEPGITRDRIHGLAEHHGRQFELIDTGGIVVHEREYIPSQILHAGRTSRSRRAAHIIFLVDGRAEITGADRDLAQMLLRLGKPVIAGREQNRYRRSRGPGARVLRLGIADVFPISAEHGIGVDALLDHVTAGFPDDRGTGPRRLPIRSRSPSSAAPTSANPRCSTRSPARSAPSFRPSPAPRATRWMKP